MAPRPPETTLDVAIQRGFGVAFAVGSGALLFLAFRWIFIPETRGRELYHSAEIKTCVDAGIMPLVPRPLTSANEARGLFTKDDFSLGHRASTRGAPMKDFLQ